MVKRDIVSRHFEVYMYCLYWMPSLGFLHPPTIWRQIEVRISSFQPMHATQTNTSFT